MRPQPPPDLTYRAEVSFRLSGYGTVDQAEATIRKMARELRLAVGERVELSSFEIRHNDSAPVSSSTCRGPNGQGTCVLARFHEGVCMTFGDLLDRNPAKYGGAVPVTSEMLGDRKGDDG